MRLLLLLALAAVAARGQGVRYERVPDERLRARLEAVKKKNAERQEEVRRQLEEAGCGRLSLEKVKGTKLWPGRSDERLMALMGRVADAQKLDLGLVDVGAVADSDSGPFVARKIPVVDVHSVTRETIGVLHSVEDKPGVVKFEHYRDAYRLVAGFLALLDSMQRRASETH